MEIMNLCYIFICRKSSISCKVVSRTADITGPVQAAVYMQFMTAFFSSVGNIKPHIPRTAPVSIIEMNTRKPYANAMSTVKY